MKTISLLFVFVAVAFGEDDTSLKRPIGGWEHYQLAQPEAHTWHRDVLILKTACKVGAGTQSIINIVVDDPTSCGFDISHHNIVHDCSTYVSGINVPCHIGTPTHMTINLFGGDDTLQIDWAIFVFKGKPYWVKCYNEQCNISPNSPRTYAFNPMYVQ